MIANSAFLAAMVLVLLVFWLGGALSFLAPYKRLILEQHLWTLVGVLVVAFVNLFSLFYLVGRTLFLKDTGRKLGHVEQQLRAPDAVERDLAERLQREDS